MTFDYLLLLTAKFGFSLLLFLMIFRWFFIIPYLYFKYDKQIISLKKELNDFKTNEIKSGGVTLSFLNKIIAEKEKQINEKLDIFETKRRLFIDRINMILSIISINK